MNYDTIEDVIGNTPLVQLLHVCAGEGENRVLAKLEGHNPAGSVKDRTAWSMVVRAQERGDIQPGDTLLEATSGNTGIALSMVAAIKGYHMRIVLPEGSSAERVRTMKAYGAEVILSPQTGGMEGARDLAEQMARSGEGHLLNQFANADNSRIHYETTGAEIWQQTGGQVTHFVSAMGTTGTITGVARYLKERNPAIKVIGAQPAEGAHIPGIRKWPEAYRPTIYDPSVVDEEMLVTQDQAEQMARNLAAMEGIFAGISSGGAAWVAQQVAGREKSATIVFIVCDRGDRYLSTGVFPV